MAAWAPLVPFAKSRVEVGDGVLGLLLLCVGAGSTATMPLAGALAARAGCRAAIVASTLLLCIALPLLATAASLPVLIAALLAFGAGVGALDVAMNLQALIVERAAQRAMMSGFHGLFSLGGVLGAAGVTALLGAGASPLRATLLVVVALLVGLVAAARGLLPRRPARAGPAFAVPRGVVLRIGALCAVAFLAEGAMLDWSAVLLVSVRGVEAAQAGLGYTCFAAAMTVGRLTGDRVVQRWGGRRVIVAGSAAASAGVVVAAFAPALTMALAGFALVGLGCANIVPVLFSSAGRQSAMPHSTAIPAIMTLGYAGLLAGPAFVGFVAQLTSLPVAFLAIAVLLLLIGVVGRRLGG